MSEDPFDVGPPAGPDYTNTGQLNLPKDWRLDSLSFWIGVGVAWLAVILIAVLDRT